MARFIQENVKKSWLSARKYSMTPFSEERERTTLCELSDEYLNDYLQDLEWLVVKRGWVRDEYWSQYIRLANEEYDRRNDPL